jgi:hypothetical protein
LFGNELPTTADGIYLLGGRTMAAQQQRPMGITILAVLGIIGGVLGILGGCGVVAGGAALGALGAQAGVGEVGALGGLFSVYGIFLLALSVGWIAFGIGAWTLKPWAWMLGLVLVGISIVLAIVSIIAGWSTIGSQIIGVAIDAVIVYYLMTPDVKKAFGRA